MFYTNNPNNPSKTSKFGRKWSNLVGSLPAEVSDFFSWGLWIVLSAAGCGPPNAALVVVFWCIFIVGRIREHHSHLGTLDREVQTGFGVCFGGFKRSDEDAAPNIQVHVNYQSQPKLFLSTGTHATARRVAHKRPQITSRTHQGTCQGGVAMLWGLLKNANRR